MAVPPVPACRGFARCAALLAFERPCRDTDSYGRGLVSVSRTRTLLVAMVVHARLKVRAWVSIRFALVELARRWGSVR